MKNPSLSHRPFAPARPALAAAALAALLHGLPAGAQTFSLEGAVIDSRNSQSLGVINERGDINSLFRAQKALTFGILRAAGVSLDQLSPEVRARIERFQTTNLEAFRAFSQGLDLKDQGKFVEAKEFFRRAAQLDPGFALAAEQQVSMPDVNLGSGVQTRAVINAAAGNAVDKGKASFVIDVARATAALQAGANVVLTTVAPAEVDLKFSANKPGSGGDFVPNLGIAITVSLPADNNVFGIATGGEYKKGEYKVQPTTNVLDSLGTPAQGLQVLRADATGKPVNVVVLGDESKAYWGQWDNSAGKATLTLGTAPPTPQTADNFYAYGEATRTMPTVNPGGSSVSFTPKGGSLSNVTGSVTVDFLNRTVSMNNLGFGIGSLAFANLAGTATYSRDSGSGLFSGNYSAGSCTGCVAFDPAGSFFSGNFLGRNANGLVLATTMDTGAAGNARFAPGVHIFGRP